MTADDMILTSLIGISATVALMLAAAWRDLGRPLHARTWSIGLALGTIIWMLAFAAEYLGPPPAGALAITPVLGGACAAIIVTGFRERAGLPDRHRIFLGLTAVYAAIVLALALLSRSRQAGIAPMCGWNATMFVLAARTLRGRRHGERTAERMAEAGLMLLALFHALVLGGMIGDAAGLLTLDLARLGALVMILLPTVLGGIGLFTIILITADLADRTRRLAATDMLTGLLNRRGFDEAAHAVFAATRRDGRPMALVIIDIDRFKEINDRFGHPAGDRVLRILSTRLTQAIGRRDVFARIGGEEFALILTDVDPQAASCAVEVLRRHIETTEVDLPRGQRVTASFGVAAPERPDDDFAELFQRADQALYRSKQDGRNRVTMSPPDDG